MNLHKILFFLVLFLIFFSLYRENVSVKKKKIIEQKTLNFLQASLDGNVSVMEDVLSDNAFDLGRGFNNNGKVEFAKHKNNIINYVNSNEFKTRTNSLTLKNTLYLHNVKVFDFDEIMKNKELQVETFGFKILPGDYLIIIPSKSNNYFSDTIFAYYRLENNVWKIIATN